MSSLDQARQSQIRNIEVKTGKSLEAIRKLISESGLAKHGEIRDMLKKALGLGHGDANALVHYALNSDGQGAAEASGASIDEITGQIYVGPKAALRPIHDRAVAEIGKFGPFETVPKKGYVSLRRKKQFAMIGPATKGEVEIGLNMKGVEATGRLQALPPGGMCQYRVRLADPAQVDAELLAWVRQAYDGAG